MVLFLNTEDKNGYFKRNNYTENHTGYFIKYCIFYGDLCQLQHDSCD